MVGEKKVIIAPSEKNKPTRYRFKGNIRLGFKGKKVTEIVEFKKGK